MIEIGDTVTRPYVFTRENIKLFADETGDNNPLHHDEAEAGASRFGGIIACGAHMSGVLMSLGATQLAGKKENVGLEFTFRFVKAIPAGTETTLSWTITAIEPSEKLKGHLIFGDGQIADASGVVYVTAKSKAVMWD